MSKPGNSSNRKTQGTSHPQSTQKEAEAKKSAGEKSKKSSEELRKEREAREAQESKARDLEIAKKERLAQERLQQQRDMKSQQIAAKAQAHNQKIADALSYVKASQSEEQQEANLKKIQDDLDRKSAGRQKYLGAVEEHRGVEYLEDRLSRPILRSGSADIVQDSAEENVQQSVQQNISSVVTSLADELGDEDQDERDEVITPTNAAVQGQTNIQNEGVNDDNEFEEEVELDEAEDLDEEFIAQHQATQVGEDGDIATQQNTLEEDELGEEEDNEYEDDFDLEPEPYNDSALSGNPVNNEQSVDSRFGVSPNILEPQSDSQVLEDIVEDVNEMRERVDKIVAAGESQADIQAQIIREQELAGAAATPVPDDALEEEILEEDQEEVDNGLDIEVEDVQYEQEENQPENNAAVADEERLQAELQANILREQEPVGAVNVPVQQNEPVNIDDITEEYLFGRDEEELVETLETAAKGVVGAIKINAGRKQVFEDFRAILTDDTIEDKLESTKQFLQNGDVVAAFDKDTSLGLFAGIVSEVADHGAIAEDRLGFITALTEKFGHLAEDVDVVDKEKESQNIGRAFEGIRADIADNTQFTPFEEIVTRRFQGVFAEAVQALNGVDPEAVKNLAQNNLQAAQKPEKPQDPSPKPLEEKQQNDQKSQDELPVKKQEKGKFTGKKSGDNLFDDLGPTDFAKAGFSVAAIVALSVAFPGFGTIIGIAIAGGIYALSEKKESAIDRSSDQKDLENVLETGIPESAKTKGKVALQAVRDATTGFVRGNNEELEEQKSGLRTASQKLGEANKTAQIRRDQQTTVSTGLDPENRENEDPNRKALQSAIEGLRGKSVQGSGKATDIVPTKEAREALEEENKKTNAV